MAGEVRILCAGDEALLVSFLEKHLETSIFMLSNAERGGIVDRGERAQATYAAAFDGSVIESVAAHCWNGNVLLQGDGGGVEAAVRLAVTTSGRRVRGVIGPLGLVRRARSALELDGEPVAFDSEDRLFVLELEKLRVPALLGDPDFAYRVPTERDAVERVAEWRVAYQVELLGAERSLALEQWTLEDTHRQRLAENCWVLTRRDEPVAFTMVTGNTRGIVQVGGVYTPPELRRKGFGRSVVAASLLVARGRGLTRSTLFTGVDNLGAIRAYTALGYERTLPYAFFLLR